MHITVMDLQDPQDKAPMATPAPTGAYQEIRTIRPRQSAWTPRKMSIQAYSRMKDMTCARYGAKRWVSGREELWGLSSPSSPYSAPLTASCL